MNKLSIHLENCYGIGEFKEVIDFSSANTVLIYAPNGTMKTSFARTFDCISKNDKKVHPSDRVYLDRNTKYAILADDIPIESSTILVVNAEDDSYDSTDKISSFIASKELKKSIILPENHTTG
jgi:hypothetical protein